MNTKYSIDYTFLHPDEQHSEISTDPIEFFRAVDNVPTVCSKNIHNEVYAKIKNSEKAGKNFNSAINQCNDKARDLQVGIIHNNSNSIKCTVKGHHRICKISAEKGSGLGKAKIAFIDMSYPSPLNTSGKDTLPLPKEKSRKNISPERKRKRSCGNEQEQFQKKQRLVTGDFVTPVPEQSFEFVQEIQQNDIQQQTQWESLFDISNMSDMFKMTDMTTFADTFFEQNQQFNENCLQADNLLEQFQVPVLDDLMAFESSNTNIQMNDQDIANFFATLSKEDISFIDSLPLVTV